MHESSGGDLQRDVRHEAKAAYRALQQAEKYLAQLARPGSDIPPSRTEIDAVIAELRVLRRELLGWRALALAAFEDVPVPVSVFKPWASATRIYQWRKDQSSPLRAVELNGKVCVRPSNFFEALCQRGRTKHEAGGELGL